MEETRQIYENNKNYFNFFDRRYNRLKKPLWMRRSKDTRFDVIYDEQDLLFKEGNLALAYLVQANSLLFKQGIVNCPADIIFSEDPYFDDNPEMLEQLASELYELKESEVEDLELMQFSEVITDEMTAIYNTPLPLKMTNHKLVYYTSIMVHRKHLPTDYIKTGWFPVLTNPDKTKASIILPYKYWAPGMVNIWF